MEIRFSVDIKSVRKAFALMEIDIPSDEEIESKLSNKVVNLEESYEEEEVIKQAKLGFILIAIGQAFSD